jgi:hypothetical protein
MNTSIIRLAVAVAALVALTAPLYFKPADMEIVTKTDTLVVAKQIEANVTCVPQNLWGLPHKDVEVKCAYAEIGDNVVAVVGPGVRIKIAQGFAVGIYAPV